MARIFVVETDDMELYRGDNLTLAEIAASDGAIDYGAATIRTEKEVKHVKRYYANINVDKMNREGIASNFVSLGTDTIREDSQFLNTHWGYSDSLYGSSTESFGKALEYAIEGAKQYDKLGIFTEGR